MARNAMCARKETLEHLFVDEKIKSYFTVKPVPQIPIKDFTLDITKCKTFPLRLRHLTTTPMGFYFTQECLESLIKDFIEPDEMAGVTELHIAAAAGDVAKVNKLMSSRKELINSKTVEDGFTPLQFAIAGNHLKVMKTLLSGNADPNIGEEVCYTPLVIATLNGYLDAVRLLVGAGGNPNPDSNQPDLLLKIAAANGNAKLVKFYISIGIFSLKAAPTNRVAATSLSFASEKGHPEIVKMLLAKGAPAKEEFGCCDIGLDAVSLKTTALHLAVQHGRKDIVKLLIEAGASVSAKTSVGVLPLHLCALKGHLNIVKELIKYGADVNCKDCEWFTPLHYAAMKGQTDVAKVLLKNGANVNAATRQGFVPLFIAAISGSTSLVKLMMKEYNADVHALDNGNRSLIYPAVTNGNPDILRLLLEAGVDPNIKRINGYSIMHHAALTNASADCVRLLLKYGARFVEPDKLNWSLLHFAANLGAEVIVQVLIDDGVNVNSIASNGFTPLHVAISKQRLSVCKILIENGADVNATCVNKFTSLHIAVNLGSKQAVKLLLDKSALVDPKMDFNITPLHFAARYNRVVIAKFLIQKDADVNAVFEGNVSSLHLSTGCYRYRMVKLLLKHGAYYDVLGGKEPPIRPYQLARLDISNVLYLFKVNIAFYHATYKGDCKTIESSVEEGALVNLRGTRYGTGLVLAARQGHADVILLLANSGADLKARDIDGCMAIHHAARKNMLDSVLALLTLGSPFEPLNFKNHTPATLAQRANNRLIRDLLDFISNHFAFAEEGNVDRLSDLSSIKYVNEGVFSAVTRATNNKGNKLMAHAINCGQSEYANRLLLLIR